MPTITRTNQDRAGRGTNFHIHNCHKAAGRGIQKENYDGADKNQYTHRRNKTFESETVEMLAFIFVTESGFNLLEMRQQASQ